MEISTGSSRSSEKKPALESSPAQNGGKMVQEEEELNGTAAFINHAAIVWHENRRKWIGDQPRHSQKQTKYPIISWSATYEDLLSTSETFSEPIPLQEMVDFLVDIWHDEGLYD